MKKTLLISFNFQSYNPRAIRWFSVLNFVSKKKKEIDLITYSNNLYKNLENINVHAHENRIANKFKKNIDPLRLESENFFLKLSKLLIFKFIKILYKYFGKYFIWPDYAFFSINTFYKTALKLIEEKKINHIITVSHPFSCHIVGLLIKKKFPKIIWDADNSDPFSLMKEPKPNNIYIYKYLNFFFEKKILNNCRRFYVNNKQTEELYKKYFKKFKKKIYISEPLCLFSPKKNTHQIIKNKKFNLIYAGSFYDDIRSPVHFLYIMNRLIKKFPILYKEIEINVFTDSGIFQDELSNFPLLKSIIKIYKPIEHKILMNLMTSDKIVLNIGNKNNIQIPSKLYEMIGNRVKIINIHHDIDTVSKKILNNYPFHINVNIDKELNIDILYSFIKQNIKKKINIETIKKKYKKNTIEFVASNYFG